MTSLKKRLLAISVAIGLPLAAMAADAYMSGDGTVSSSGLLVVTSLRGGLVTVPASGALAPILSPALTGTPTAPTAATTDSSTTIATTALVTAKIAAIPPPTSSGSGTVTSVGLTAPAGLAVAGSPITTSGNIALTFANEPASYVIAAPSAGGVMLPRQLTALDILPSLSYNAITFSPSLTVNASLDQMQGTTLTANTTLACPTNMLAGNSYQFLAIQDGTGGHTMTFPSCFRFGNGGGSPSLSVSPNAQDIIGYTALPGNVTAFAQILPSDSQVISIAHGGTGQPTSTLGLAALGGIPLTPGDTTHLIDAAGNLVNLGTNVSYNSSTHTLSATGGGGGGAPVIVPLILTTCPGSTPIVASSQVIGLNLSTPAACTVTLPTTPNPGRYTIVDVAGNAGTYPITVVAPSGWTLSGGGIINCNQCAKDIVDFPNSVGASAGIYAVNG